jgi:hypothetical protein
VTPAEIISLARRQFGESEALTITDVTFQDWLNLALKELYTDLHPDLLRNLIGEDPLTLTAGTVTLPAEWDRVREVLRSDGTPLFHVPPEVITFIDATAGNPFMVPMVGAYSRVGQRLAVRPTSITEVIVQHQDPPAPVVFPGGATSELTAVSAHWHAALAHLVTSYAYQQEEDHNASAHWRSRYSGLVGAPQDERNIPMEEQA